MGRRETEQGCSGDAAARVCRPGGSPPPCSPWLRAHGATLELAQSLCSAVPRALDPAVHSSREPTGGCGQARPRTAGWGAPTQRAIEVFLYARLQSPFFATQQPEFTPCSSWDGGKEPQLPRIDAARPGGAGLEGARCSSWLWLVLPQRGPPQSSALLVPWEVLCPQAQLLGAAQPQQPCLGRPQPPACLSFPTRMGHEQPRVAAASWHKSQQMSRLSTG